MKCSSCGKDLEEGTAKVHGTRTGFFLFGFSYQPLFLRERNGSEEELLEPDSDYEAFLCRECNLVVINTVSTPWCPPSEANCQRCGRPNDPEWNYCGNCGQRLK